MRQPGELDWAFRKAMASAGVTQRQLGGIVGINHTLLSIYTHGRYVLTSVERKRIAKALGMPESEVFDF